VRTRRFNANCRRLPRTSLPRSWIPSCLLSPMMMAKVVTLLVRMRRLLRMMATLMGTLHLLMPDFTR